MASTSSTPNGKPESGKILGYLIKRPAHQQQQPQQSTKRLCLDKDHYSNLPVCKHKEAFFRIISDNPTLLIVGETGSGKTTQIPKWCIEYCNKRAKNLAVACTQPRRIAAMSVSARVASEMNVRLGQEVGYSVRFESASSPQTVLKYLTDGMLLREAMLDGLLSSYGVIILDEAHERTLQTEILFGVVKRAMIARNSSDKNLPPLKVIVMSATMNIKLFKRYFSCPILSIEGRQHQVQDMFTETSQSDLLTSTLVCVFQIHRTCDEGDILVFCSGQDEIQSLVTMCKKVLKQAPESLQNLTPLPLFASLPSEHQLRVFQPNPKSRPATNGFSNHSASNSSNSLSFDRRVIFATNVAETSITIPNIKYVIDTGKVKCRTYCPKTGLESLKVTTISKAQAKQRSGRAGRVGPGTCYRLYTSDEFTRMNDYLPPEIRRCNLDAVLLQVISIGINDIGSFEFLERPHETRIKAAINNLLALKAIKTAPIRTKTGTELKLADSSVKHDQTNSTKKSLLPFQSGDDASVLNLSFELTDLGRKLCVFPLAPSMSRIIIAANELGCLDEALTAISLLYVENLFHIPPNRQSQADQILEKFRTNEGDVVMLLKVFKAFRRTSLLNRQGLKQWCTEHFIHIKNLKLARMIRKQLLDSCKSLGMSPSTCGQDTSILRKALTYGLFNNVATMWNGKYQNKSCEEIHIHPSSCLFKTRPECILYVEIVETNKCYMRNCSLIDQNWVREISSANLVGNGE